MRKSCFIITAVLFSAMICVSACNSDDVSEACEVNSSKCVGTDVLKLCGQSGVWTTITCKSPATCVDLGTKHACMTEDELPDYTIGAECDQTEFRQKCINDGLNALICWDRKVTAWDCISCDSTSADPNKPLQVNCVQIDTSAKRPENVPATCDKNTDSALCGDDGNAWFCGDNGYYLSSKGKCKDKGLNCIQCSNGYVTCGENEESSCRQSSDVTTDNRPEDIPATCAPNDPAKCSAIDGNAWFCGDNGYYLSNRGKCKEKGLNCIECPNGYITCGSDVESSCNSSSTDPYNRPADVPETCNKATDDAMCGSDGNAWFCGNNGYYLSNKGKCAEQSLNCIECPNGYVTCGTDETSACNSGGSTTQRPSNVPATCTKGTDKALCGSDGNAWFCGDNGYYLSNKGKCAEQSLNCIACSSGYVTCGTDESSACNSGSTTTQRPSNVPATCNKSSDGGICGNDGNAWFCGDNGYYLSNKGKCAESGLQCITCRNGYVGCGTSEKSFCNSSYDSLPADLKDKTCNPDNDAEKTICGSDGNLYYCGDYGYYLTNSGRCSDKGTGYSCYQCTQSSSNPNYKGCAKSERSLCNSSYDSLPSELKNKSCNPNNDAEKTICGSDNNMYYCGDYGYYLTNTGRCKDKGSNYKCYQCSLSTYNPNYKGCATSANSLCNKSYDSLPSELKRNCTNGEYACGSDNNVYRCGEYGFYVATKCSGEKPVCLSCGNGYYSCHKSSCSD